MNSKKVSFIIAAFNEECFVEECVSSCLQQSHENTEICITDDGSLDRTWSILDDKYSNNDRVKLRHLDSNHGKVAAFNSSYSMSTGDYIAIIGADDVNYPNRVERQLKYIQDQDLDLTWSGLDICDATLNKISSLVLNISSAITVQSILENNIVAGGTIMMTRQLAESIFPIPEELPFEDWWIGYKAALLGRIGYLPEKHIMYRQHAGNSAGGSDKSDVAQTRSNFKRHFYCYSLMRQDIAGRHNLKDKEELLGIIDGSVIYKRICIEDSVIRRFAIIYGGLTAINYLAISTKMKLIFVLLFGFSALNKLKKLTRIKY